jgi:hypothetical protein
VLVGCGFQSTTMATTDANQQQTADGSIDAMAVNPPDAMPDAQVCFGSGLVKVCLDSAPTAPVSYSGMTSLDTSNVANCTRTFPNPGGPELCVVAGTTVTVAGTLTVTGSRALVLIGATTLGVPGTLDVSSTLNTNPRRGAGANTGACQNASAADSDSGGAGGGGGGSFATKGGNGGTGDLNDSGNPRGTARGGNAGNALPAPTFLRGGCRGGDGGAADNQHNHGRGGDSGGAVYLIAATSISITGDVFASGAGGNTDPDATGAEEGGGGGGTGGMIGIDAPVIAISGRVAANGGAGGGGGALNAGGAHGGDGSTINWNARASKGTRAMDPAGDGGDGAPGTAVGQIDNLNGTSSDGGGGGGGGGLGVIWIDGTVTDGSKVSPAPTPH